MIEIKEYSGCLVSNGIQYSGLELKSIRYSGCKLESIQYSRGRGVTHPAMYITDCQEPV